MVIARGAHTTTPALRATHEECQQKAEAMVARRDAAHIVNAVENPQESRCEKSERCLRQAKRGATVSAARRAA